MLTTVLGWLFPYDWMRCSKGLIPASTRLIQPSASIGAVQSLQPTVLVGLAHNGEETGR